jgi:hypothetical protein
MRLKHARLSATALLVANALACSGGGSPSDYGQAIAVQIFPEIVALTPRDTLQFSAYVTGTSAPAVTWEVAEATGGTVGTDGLYSAPQDTGVFHVVARSTAAPAAAATAEVTVTTTPGFATGRAIGANLSWWTYWDSQAFADTARQGGYRRADGSFLANTDALGWPAEDFTIYFGTHAAGDYQVTFTGRATVSGVTLAYDPATNTSTGRYTVTSPSRDGYSGLTFRGTQRVNGGPTNAGLTNLKIMRPGRAFDVGTAATRFEPDYVAAVQTFQWFRAMTTFGTASSGVNGNSDAYWTDADAIAAGIPAYQAGATYTFGDKVMSNGKVYLATFPIVSSQTPQSGTAAGNAPNHGTKGIYSEGPVPVDGSVYWRRAARVMPHGSTSNSGPAWEDLILLANRTGTAPWFAIPYFATDTYVTKLARLIKYGSDANGEPYSSVQVNPVHPPLRATLPFIVEWSNEIWNGTYPYPAWYHFPAMHAGSTAGNPWKLTGTDYYAHGAQGAAALAARMSVLFRRVFGDADMMTRVRPVFAWQLANGGQTGSALSYLNAVWNNPANPTVNGYEANHPVSWYLYGIAGAPYVPWTGSTSDELFASWSATLAGTVTPWLNAYDQLASTHGIRSLAYEGGNERSSAAITQAQTDARYATALSDVTHAFWNTPRGTADLYVHFRMDCSGNNSGLGIPAAAPYGDGDFLTAYRRSIVSRDTPGWNAMRALRAERR